ncbi:stage II sporulation protein P [Paenibacillus sp. TRM 82003]|nr:stage II sporulation protein P [Paenibacillus sp. TRM 82003]
MRNRSGMRWVTGIVTVCAAVGTMGFVAAHPLQAPQQSLERMASVVAGSVFRLQLELPGSGGILNETALLSPKGDTEALASVADGTSPEADLPEGAAGEPTGAEAALPSAENETVPAIAEPVESDSTPAPGSASQEEVPDEAKRAAAMAERKVAFIYHSHNRESWLPELEGTGKDRPNEAFDGEVNVSLLGERMQRKLEEDGVGAVHSDADYNTSVPSFNYNYSYKYSKTTVKEALAVHKDLVYIFDIHRDSQRRKTTTITIDGEDYAKLFFIIGQGNPNWEENEAFAKRIHEEMEAVLPGVSKGILTKGTKHGHGEYNQSLSSNSLLIEIGGVDNTLEESYRTIDALASIVAELVMEAEKVDAPAKPPAAADPA